MRRALISHSSNRFFSTAFFTLQPKNLSKAKLQPHSPEHNKQVHDYLKKHDPLNTFIETELEPGTRLESDMPYPLIAGTNPLRRPGTPPSDLPSFIQAKRERIQSNFGTRITRLVEIEAPVKVVANPSKTTFFVAPDAYSPQTDFNVKP